MNVDQLQKQFGQLIRLRPLPIRIGPHGDNLPRRDDRWQLDAIRKNPTRVCLVNIHTGHFIELQSDNVREYRSPDYLLLRCQLLIRGSQITVEPILSGAV